MLVARERQGSQGFEKRGSVRNVVSVRLSRKASTSEIETRVAVEAFELLGIEQHAAALGRLRQSVCFAVVRVAVEGRIAGEQRSLERREGERRVGSRPRALRRLPLRGRHRRRRLPPPASRPFHPFRCLRPRVLCRCRPPGLHRSAGHRRRHHRRRDGCRRSARPLHRPRARLRFLVRSRSRARAPSLRRRPPQAPRELAARPVYSIRKKRCVLGVRDPVNQLMPRYSNGQLQVSAVKE